MKKKDAQPLAYDYAEDDTGKTLLAQKLLERYRYPYFSVDHLKMGLIHSRRCKNCGMNRYDQG